MKIKTSVKSGGVGQQSTPSLSPDGNQFVFTWDGDVPHGKPHVYISLVGKGTPLRLTPEDVFAVAPSWSSDGQSIALWRGQGDHFGEPAMPLKKDVIGAVLEPSASAT